MVKIVLIVGASGVGKDTLLKNIKDKVEANFAKRYITREPDMNEDNFYIDIDAFKLLKENDFFISSWEAHGNLYGIAKNQIQEGLNIISVSRGSVGDFEKIYDDVTTIEVTASRDILLERLKKRQREDEKEVQNRLNRNYKAIQAKNLIQYSNDFGLNESIQRFATLIGSL